MTLPYEGSRPGPNLKRDGANLILPENRMCLVSSYIRTIQAFFLILMWGKFNEVMKHVNKVIKHPKWKLH